MGDESGAPMKGKPSGKDSSKEPKKEKLSVSAMLARMDQKDSASSRAKGAPKKPSPYDDIELPPSDEEDDGDSDEEQRQAAEARRKLKSEQRRLDISVTDDDERRRREMKKRAARQAIEPAKREALKDDHEWMGCCGIIKLLYKITRG